MIEDKRQSSKVRHKVQDVIVIVLMGIGDKNNIRMRG